MFGKWSDGFWMDASACLCPPDSNAVAGESALDRIACGLGGKIILPMIKQHIMQMLQNRKSTPPRAEPRSLGN